jgi:hypothetical protein
MAVLSDADFEDESKKMMSYLGCKFSQNFANIVLRTIL